MTGWIYETAIGALTLGEEDGAIVHLGFPGAAFPSGAVRRETPLLKEAGRELEEYFAGKRSAFDLPLNPQGTEFMKRVWKALLEIPYGQTASYKDIAIKAGSPKGFRAVGLANNRNPIAIFIPCHRVIGSNGGLVGYAGGLGVKERLLALEKENVHALL